MKITSNGQIESRIISIYNLIELRVDSLVKNESEVFPEGYTLKQALSEGSPIFGRIKDNLSALSGLSVLLHNGFNIHSWDLDEAIETVGVVSFFESLLLELGFNAASETKH